MMTEAITIQFEDLETMQEACAIVRYNDLSVAVTLSHKQDGDLQVVMKKEEAARLLEALQTALKKRAV